MKTVLTIAGSDPTGGAGLQADLAVFRAMGLTGLSVVSAVTAQNTEGVRDIFAIPAHALSSQMTTLLDDIRPDSLKTGMLYTADNIRAISEHINSYSLRNLVIDPVTISSTGVNLAAKGMLETLIQYLFPLASVITPNRDEAAALAGMDIHSHDDMKEAAVRLKGLGPGAVIITGGHMEGNPADLLFDGKEFMSLENDKIDGEFHGTGCAFSAAMAACLALGHSVSEAFIKAKSVVYDAIASARQVGKGLKLLNIMSGNIQNI